MTEFHKLPRLFSGFPIKEGQAIVLEAAQAHYLRNVMRLGEDSQIRMFDGKNGEFLAHIKTPGKKETLAIATKQIRQQPAQSLSLHLLFAPIKKMRMDILIEKAVELGATELTPVLTERTENRKINTERLESQIIEALEQCERLIKPTLHPLQKLETAIQAWKKPHILACLERQGAPHITEYLARNTEADTAILIGPEGGFSGLEIKMIEGNAACTAVSLGSAILRTETAALYALSIAGGVFCKSAGMATKIG